MRRRPTSYIRTHFTELWHFQVFFFSHSQFYHKLHFIRSPWLRLHFSGFYFPHIFAGAWCKCVRVDKVKLAFYYRMHHNRIRPNCQVGQQTQNTSYSQSFFITLSHNASAYGATQRKENGYRIESDPHTIFRLFDMSDTQNSRLMSQLNYVFSVAAYWIYNYSCTHTHAQARTKTYQIF